jgi:hypothetical protein
LGSGVAKMRRMMDGKVRGEMGGDHGRRTRVTRGHYARGFDCQLAAVVIPTEVFTEKRAEISAAQAIPHSGVIQS